MMERQRPRLAVKAELLLDPVGDVLPLIARQTLAFQQAHIGMKERPRAVGLGFGAELRRDKSIPDIVDRKTAQFDQLGSLAFLAGREIERQFRAVAMQIAL